MRLDYSSLSGFSKGLQEAGGKIYEYGMKEVEKQRDADRLVAYARFRTWASRLYDDAVTGLENTPFEGVQAGKFRGLDDARERIEKYLEEIEDPQLRALMEREHGQLQEAGHRKYNDLYQAKRRDFHRASLAEDRDLTLQRAQVAGTEAEQQEMIDGYISRLRAAQRTGIYTAQEVQKEVTDFVGKHEEHKANLLIDRDPAAAKIRLREADFLPNIPPLRRDELVRKADAAWRSRIDEDERIEQIKDNQIRRASEQRARELLQNLDKLTPEDIDRELMQGNIRREEARELRAYVEHREDRSSPYAFYDAHERIALGEIISAKQIRRLSGVSWKDKNILLGILDRENKEGGAGGEKSYYGLATGLLKSVILGGDTPESMRHENMPQYIAAVGQLNQAIKESDLRDKDVFNAAVTIAKVYNARFDPASALPKVGGRRPVDAADVDMLEKWVAESYRAGTLSRTEASRAARALRLYRGYFETGKLLSESDKGKRTDAGR